MKKYVKFILLLFFLFTFFSTNVFAKQSKLKVDSVKVVDKSNTVLYDDSVIVEDNININATFKEKDDFIIYEVSIKNIDDKRWRIESISDNNSNKNLDIKYDYSTSYIDKNDITKVKIKLLYKDKLINTPSVNISDILVSLNLLSENGKSASIIINNPITHDGIVNYLILLSLGIFGIILIKTKKRLKKLKIGNLIVIITVIMSPFMIFAEEKYQLDFKISTIKLESEMLSYNVLFNSNGGSKVNSKEVTYGDSVGELSIPIRSGYEFEGWYQDLDFTISVTEDTIITGDTTFYAKWSKVPFTISFSNDESISFTGENYINTGVHLNSEENHLKDYEIYFEIDKFDPTDQGNSNYMTFFSTKYETLDDLIVPGIAVRLNENRIEITQSLDSIAKTVSMEAAKVKSIKIVRKDGITYYSFNGNPLAELCNANTSIDKFDMPAIFGAAMTRDGQIFRNVNATLSNMYIKVGEYSDDDFYTIVFNPNGGTINSSQKLLNKNEKIGALPSASLVNYYNDGWYTDLSGGEKITSNTIPNDNVTYYAHWMKSLEAAELEDNELIFNVGTTKKINILNESEIEEEYTFTSSDKTVATVDNLGNVLGISEGETLITIKGKKSQKTKQVVVKVNVGKSAIKFNTNGGYSLDSKVVSTNSEVGELPIPTRIFYKFEGWYKDSDFNEKVTTTTIVDNDVVYYAKWSKKELTTVFSQSGACTFNGKDGVIEGEECSNYAGEKYIDTGISLYNSENYNKDFEITFEIDEYDPNNQDSGSNQIFMNSKLENSSSGYPGIVFRRISADNLEISQTIQKVKVSKSIKYSEVNKVRILRDNNIIYYSINNSELVKLQDISDLVQYFDTTVWFGAAPNSNGNPFRHIKATLSKMYIKLED